MSLTEIVTVHSNGNVKERYFIDKNNRKNGLYQAWYEIRNNKVKYEYKDGNINGLSQSWYEDGVHKLKCEYKDGKLDGLYQSWYENGTPKLRCEYKDGKLYGAYQLWYENGNKYFEYEYKDDKLNGLCQAWCLDGAPKVKCEYKDDKIIKVIEMNDINGRNCVLQDGILEVWKGCKFNDINVYVKLSVPAHAKRITPINDKYKSRVEFAQVEKIIDKEGKEYTEAVSFVHSTKLAYRVGEFVYPDGFDDDVATEYGKGINVHKYKDHCDVWFN